MDDKKVAIDIGSGRAKVPGYITLDNDPKVGADMRQDITQGTSFGTGTVDEIRCSHVLEHIATEYKVKVMAEFHRILKLGGILDIEVSLFPTPQSVQDPTHISFWNKEAFWYFIKGNKFHEGFKARYSKYEVPSFILVEDELRNGWAYQIKLQKPYD